MSLTVEDVRIDDPAFYAGDPYSIYARLRREAQVYWYEPAGDRRPSLINRT